MEVFDLLPTVIWFFILFGLVVLSHEFGHFIVAKASGIGVKEFFIGFGPTLFSFKRKGTKYSVKLLPLGGACVFEGMDGLVDEKEEKDAQASDEEEEAHSGSFLKASVWARFATVFAGPFFNIILGFIIAFIMVNMIEIRDPVATQVMEGSAAEAAGLLDGDRIISLNGSRIYLFDDISLFNALYNGKDDVLVVYERNGAKGETVLKPLYSEEYGRYMLGISNSDFIDLKGADAFKYTWYEMRYNLKMTYGSLGMLFGGRVKRTDVAGPVGVAVNIVGATYENTKQYGWVTVLVNMMNIALMLTVNLAIINLLPIPALDGGRLLFIIIEMLRGKPVPPEKEAMVHFAGTIFFLVLVVFIFFNDLRNIFGF